MPSMDDLTKQYLRKAKKDAVEVLLERGREAIAALGLAEVDPRLEAYCLGLVENPEAHNLFELLALRRFISFCHSYELRPNVVKSKIVVFESLRFPSEKGLRPIKLSPVQVFALTGIYGFYRADGKRLTRNVMLFVPRKFGKTTLVAGIAIDELIFGDADGQIFACANSYQQAKLCFDTMRDCIRALDKTGRRFRVNREVIFNKMRGRTSFARCLASNPSTLDGLNASLYILDEFSQSKSAELRNVMATSTGTRENPLEIIITTASELQEGPCVDTLEAYKQILLGAAEDDSVFALIFQPDADDIEGEASTWRKVQPHLGYTVKEDYYQNQWAKAQQTADNMLAFRTKLLNLFAVNDAKAWITGDEIRDLFKPFSFDDLVVDTPPITMVSFDLSVWDDFSAVTYEVYDQARQSFHFHTDYYLPEETLGRHARAELYRSWADKGYLHLLPGSVIDYDLVIKDIIARNGRVLIAGIGYDPYHSKQAVNMLQAYGAGSVLKPIKQTYGAFTGAVETLEMMIKTKQCTFTPNPITAWCFGNCDMDEDSVGNRKPIKRIHSAKIDGAITCLMCQDLFINFKR